MKIVNIIKKLFEIKSNNLNQFKANNVNQYDKKVTVIDINQENSLSLLKNKELIADECFYNNVLTKLDSVMNLKSAGNVRIKFYYLESFE